MIPPLALLPVSLLYPRNRLLPPPVQVVIDWFSQEFTQRNQASCSPHPNPLPQGEGTECATS